MTRIIHDCDPSNDDALGIVAASGHLGADRTARNTAIAVAMLAGDLPPVSAGAATHRAFVTALSHAASPRRRGRTA